MFRSGTTSGGPYSQDLCIPWVRRRCCARPYPSHRVSRLGPKLGAYLGAYLGPRSRPKRGLKRRCVYHPLFGTISGPCHQMGNGLLRFLEKLVRFSREVSRPKYPHLGQIGVSYRATSGTGTWPIPTRGGPKGDTLLGSASPHYAKAWCPKTGVAIWGTHLTTSVNGGCQKGSKTGTLLMGQ